MKNSTSARTALSVISWPQVGPTDSNAAISPTWPSVVRSSSTAVGSSTALRIRILRSPVASSMTSWMRASAATPAGRTSAISSTPASVVTSKDVPPSKSIPRFRPRRTSASTLTTTTVADTTRARRHSAGKSRWCCPAAPGPNITPPPRFRCDRPTDPESP